MNDQKYIISDGIRKTATAVSFLTVFLLALSLRTHTFNLPHITGDQLHYVGLAFKLDTGGLENYNLRNLNIDINSRYPELVRVVRAQDKGHLLKQLESENITYYDQPLHHIPFGFPTAIMVSHKLFAAGAPYSLLALPDEEKIVAAAPPGTGLRDFRFPPAIADAQFYSVVVPLAFSLLMIILVYFLARGLYGNVPTALTAMFLLAISPIDLITSQKLWADDMTAALTLLAALLYLLSVEKKTALAAFAAGVSCGLAAVTKQSGAFLIFVVIIWHFTCNSSTVFREKGFAGVVFDRYLLLFGVGAALTAGYWFTRIWVVYGSPAYMPYQAGIAQTAKTAWFGTVGGRPRILYLAGIPYQNPLFTLAYLSPIWLWLDRKNARKTLFLIVWIAVFLYIFQIYRGGGGKEHRYMLPAYPAFAVLGAYVANRLRTFIDNRCGLPAGSVLLVLALIASAFWSAPMGLKVVIYNKALLFKPF